MMRYFFNLAGAVYDPDLEGIELPDLAAAPMLYGKEKSSGSK
jgi:hypothetical protein